MRLSEDTRVTIHTVAACVALWLLYAGFIYYTH